MIVKDIRQAKETKTMHLSKNIHKTSTHPVTNIILPSLTATYTILQSINGKDLKFQILLKPQEK